MSQANVVLYNFVVKSKKGRILQSSKGSPAAFIEGKNQVIPAVESILKSLEVGDSTTVSLSAKDAYGDYQENLVIEIKKEKFKRNLQIDDQVEVKTPSGKVTKMKVVDFKDDAVVLDGNHDLAGMDIQMVLDLVERREASKREVESGVVGRF